MDLFQSNWVQENIISLLIKFFLKRSAIRQYETTNLASDPKYSEQLKKLRLRYQHLKKTVL